MDVKEEWEKEPFSVPGRCEAKRNEVVTFLMIMLLALPYLLYMNAVQQGRYQKAYCVMEGIVIVNFVLCSLLHITELCDFTDTISYVSAFCGYTDYYLFSKNKFI